MSGLESGEEMSMAGMGVLDARTSRIQILQDRVVSSGKVLWLDDLCVLFLLVLCKIMP